VTAFAGALQESLTLMCDECGDSFVGISSGIRNWDAVWALVTEQGWTGSPLAIGPHRCPRCRVPEPAPEIEAHAPVHGPRERWRAPRRVVGDAVVLELHGDLDMLVADEVRDTLRHAGDGHRHLVLDLNDVPMIDSTVLGLLVRAHQSAKQRGGVVCLVAPSRFILTVLHTMRLERVFPVFADTAQAVDQLTARGAPPFAVNRPGYTTSEFDPGGG
jgi:anti-sigma B factor antagonist